MPHVKDHKHHSKKQQDHDNGEGKGARFGDSRPKRRPGREEPEASDAHVDVVDVEAKAPGHHEDGPFTQAEVQAADESEAAARIEIHFFGSELLRAKFPQPFEVAEAVATDWVNGGNFDHLPIRQPLAQFAAQKGLQRAKEIEKKVLESPTTEKVAMQVLTAGMKAQGLFEQLRSRLKRD